MTNSPRKKPIRKRFLTSSPKYPDWMMNPPDDLSSRRDPIKFKQYFPDLETNRELEAEEVLERQQEHRPSRRPHTTSPAIVPESQPTRQRRAQSVWPTTTYRQHIAQIVRASKDHILDSVIRTGIDVLMYCQCPRGAYPSEKTLAFNSGKTDRTIRNHLRKLESLDIIKKWRPHRHMTNHYRWVGVPQAWVDEYEQEHARRQREREGEPQNSNPTG